MSGFSFGRSSAKKLKTCHPYLKMILELSISRSNVDFGISEGHRSTARQNKLFKEGKSKIDGIKRKGKHNKNPSQAADIYIYHKDKRTRQQIVYSKEHLAYVAGVIQCCCRDLNERGLIKCNIRWGGDWNRNGVIKLDQKFQDYPHFEIINIDR